MQVSRLDNNIPKLGERLKNSSDGALWLLSGLWVDKALGRKIHFKNITSMYPICINSNIYYTQTFTNKG